MPAMPPAVRPARPDDRAVPGLLYLSAAPYYDVFAGSELRARRLLRGVYPRRSHTASHQVCQVAEADGDVVGVLAAFPASAADRLARRFLALAVPRTPAYRWPIVLRHLRASARMTPPPPRDALYVDALAVDAGARRRGVGQALLERADELALESGARVVALDTGLENSAAQAFYEASGFRRTGVHPAADERAARAVGGRGFVSYSRPIA